MQKREGVFLQAPTLCSHFWLSFLPSHFWLSISNVFSQHLFLLKQQKIIKKKTTIEKKKMQRKEGAYLQTLTLPFHFWFPLLASCFYLFISSTFSLASSFSQAEEKKEKHKTKSQKRKKMQRKEGNYLSSLISAFGMKRSSRFSLSTFLQC